LPLKLLKFKPPFGTVLGIATILFVVAFGLVSARSFFIDTLASRLDITDPAARPLVDGLTEAAPDNPKVRLLAGVYYEKTFDVADLKRSVAEYQRAAELNPSDYNLWLAVAQAQSRLGDTDAAEAAFKLSLALAPNYADVQWAYGNFLFRQGRGSEGFPLIARAASGNPELAGPAVVIVDQIAGGDVARIHELLGDDPGVNAALTQLFISQKKYDSAIRAWAAIPTDLRQGKYQDTGQQMLSAALSSYSYRAAATIAADLNGDEASRPIIGQVLNGGFENGVKLRNAGTFEWQIADGTDPQIGLNEAQKHGGRYALAFVYNGVRSVGFRDISQLVAVEPGAHLRLEVWYRSTLKTEGKFQWQVLDPATSKALAVTSEMAPTENWTSVSVSFVVPNTSDGAKLMMFRSGCTSAACPASGTIMFDDISLSRE
jgi:tetratricopeptide (TPR) repeat protein